MTTDADDKSDAVKFTDLKPGPLIEFSRPDDDSVPLPRIPEDQLPLPGVASAELAKSLSDQELDALSRVAQPDEGESDPREDSEPDAVLAPPWPKHADGDILASSHGLKVIESRIDQPSFMSAAEQLYKEGGSFVVSAGGVLAGGGISHTLYDEGTSVDVAADDGSIDYAAIRAKRLDAWRSAIAQQMTGYDCGDAIDVDDVEATDACLERTRAAAQTVLDYAISHPEAGDPLVDSIIACAIAAAHYANLDEASTKKGRAARRARKAAK